MQTLPISNWSQGPDLYDVAQVLLLVVVMQNHICQNELDEPVVTDDDDYDMDLDESLDVSAHIDSDEAAPAPFAPPAAIHVHTHAHHLQPTCHPVVTLHRSMVQAPAHVKSRTPLNTSSMHIR